MLFRSVHAGKNNALREELIRMVGNVDARIDGVNEGIHSVLCIAKVIWKEDVAVINCVITNFTMSNLQLPSCKVGLFFNMGIESHILMKMKNCDVPPKD